MGKRSVALTYFGEGCASEGDIPSALNIAAVHKTPTIFFCRNNGYAISTQVHEAAAAGAGGGVAWGCMGCMDGLLLLPAAVTYDARLKRRVHLGGVAAADWCRRAHRTAGG